jgi:hypothetical protein
MNCLGNESKAAMENTIIPIPHVEKTAVVTRITISCLSKRVVVSKLTMTGNSAQSRNKSDLEPSIPYNLCQAGVGNLGSFHLLSSGATAVLERTVGGVSGTVIRRTVTY